MKSNPTRSGIIINADDFGISGRVSHGILDAFAAGLITSTSVIVNMPCFTDVAGTLKRSGYDCGLHLNLSCGQTLSGVTSPFFRSLNIFEIFKVYPYISLEMEKKIETEISLQFLRFFDFFGRPPSHVDSHHHIHMVPSIWKIVRKQMEIYGVVFLRNSVDLFAPHSLKSMLLSFFSMQNSRKGLSDMFFTGHGLLGSQSVMRVPSPCPGVSVFEWMVHCGYRDQGLSGFDSYIAQRELELDFLGSRESIKSLRDNFDLLSFEQAKGYL